MRGILVEVRVGTGHCHRIAIPHERLNVIDDLLWASHEIARVVGTEFHMLISSNFVRSHTMPSRNSSGLISMYSVENRIILT